MKASTRTAQDIVVTALTDTDWRVCDDRVDEDSPFAVIGFIQRSASRWEVAVYGDPIRILRFSTFDDAVAAFIEQEHTGWINEILGRMPAQTPPRRQRSTYRDICERAPRSISAHAA